MEIEELCGQLANELNRVDFKPLLPRCSVKAEIGRYSLTDNTKHDLQLSQPSVRCVVCKNISSLPVLWTSRVRGKDVERSERQAFNKALIDSFVSILIPLKLCTQFE